MAVGAETRSFLLTMTLCDSSDLGAPNPPLRQTAGRYTTAPLSAEECIDKTYRLD